MPHFSEALLDRLLENAFIGDKLLEHVLNLQEFVDIRLGKHCWDAFIVACGHRWGSAFDAFVAKRIEFPYADVQLDETLPPNNHTITKLVTE